MWVLGQTCEFVNVDSTEEDGRCYALARCYPDKKNKLQVYRDMTKTISLSSRTGTILSVYGCDGVANIAGYGGTFPLKAVIDKDATTRLLAVANATTGKVKYIHKRKYMPQ